MHIAQIRFLLGLCPRLRSSRLPSWLPLRNNPPPPRPSIRPRYSALLFLREQDNILKNKITSWGNEDNILWEQDTVMSFPQDVILFPQEKNISIISPFGFRRIQTKGVTNWVFDPPTHIAILTNFGTRGYLPEMFLKDEFQNDRLINLGVVGVKIHLLPLTRLIA